MGKNIAIAALAGIVIFIGLNNVSTTQKARQFEKERNQALEKVEKLEHENGLYLDGTCLKKIDFLGGDA